MNTKWQPNNLSTCPKLLDHYRIQAIYGTHSPYFIDLNYFDQVRLARKVPIQGLPTRECKISSYTRQKAAIRLGEISGKDPAVFTAESFVAHAIPVMNAVVNEGFFADVVVVVEGISDAGIFWALQEILGEKWDALGIAVVPAGGKNNIDRPVVVFRGLEIPTYFIFDGDAHHEKGKKESIVRNKKYQKLAEVEELVDSPDTQVNNTWAVFKECLESELKLALGANRFGELCKEVADCLGYDEPSKVLKNSEGSSAFIQAAYDKGYKVQVLEKIIKNVSALRKQ